jgi:hypothetical protein
MPDQSAEPPISEASAHFEMDFRTASFPSDALSVKRLRAIFPENFDGPGFIVDSYANNDFFFPSGPEEPAHLMRLTEMICAERTVASGSYYWSHHTEYPDMLDGEALAAIAKAKRRLESGYQYFRLADSVETARLLISLVEEEGKRQGRQPQAKGR